MSDTAPNDNQADTPTLRPGEPLKPTVTPAPNGGASAETLGAFERGTSGVSGGQAAKPSIKAEDLSRDVLLHSAPRVTVQEREYPLLGGIRLIRKLGQGGMGAVYYGINMRLEKGLAVKVLPLQTDGDTQPMIDRFIREARIAAKVNSPHVVGVYDVNIEHGIFHIQMEYVDGKSAGAYLREYCERTGKGLPESVALEICVAVATGLAEVHSHGIIHRDIKPDNIMLPRKKGAESELDFHAAKLLDLGLARTLMSLPGQSITQENAGMGTPGYMPPEQALDAPSVKEQADVYSLGATLYALLAGHAPFRGSTPMNVAMATIHNEAEPLEKFRQDISPGTCALIKRCLQKNPELRPANGTVLLRALRECREAMGEPLETIKPGASIKARAGSRGAEVRPISPTNTMPSSIVAPKQMFGCMTMTFGAMACVVIGVLVGVAGLVIISLMYVQHEQALKEEQLRIQRAKSAEKTENDGNKVVVIEEDFTKVGKLLEQEKKNQATKTTIEPEVVLNTKAVEEEKAPVVKAIEPEVKNKVEQKQMYAPLDPALDKKIMEALKRTEEALIEQNKPVWVVPVFVQRAGVVGSVEVYIDRAVKKDDVLITMYAQDNQADKWEVAAPTDGKVMGIFVKRGDVLRDGAKVMNLQGK